MGERHAWWRHRVEELGGDDAPCWFTNISRSGSTITVSVNVPNGDLTLDTVTLPEATSYGFAYSGANITDVAVGMTSAGSCDITITIDADVGGDLSYAWIGEGVVREGEDADGLYPHAGAWGNIRDGKDNEVASSSHPSEIIANWLCIFNETVA